MASRVGGVAVLLLVCGALAAHPSDPEVDAAAESVNQAIDSQMQLDVMGGDAEATQAFADLSPYLGKSKDKKLDPWESKTVASIRGMSEAKLAISTVSQDELKFASDAEEAKDVIDQTKQMAAIKKSQDKDEAASSIKKQLEEARKSLTAAADTNERLGASSDDLDTTVLLDTADGDDGIDHSLDGPVDGGKFFGDETLEEYEKNHVASSFVETDEGEENDWNPALYSGSDADVEAEIDSDISKQVSDKLGETNEKVKDSADASLDAFAKDTESAQAAVEDMKATLAKPTEKTSTLDKQDRTVAVKEATQEASEDVQLGDAQEEHKIAQSKLKASEEITAELAAAQSSLDAARSVN